jgi:hypothetical protein
LGPTNTRPPASAGDESTRARVVNVQRTCPSRNDSEHTTDGKLRSLFRSIFTHGEADLENVARDIIGLTKLNYNSCSLGDAKPVTIEYLDAVGEILVSNPTVSERRSQLRFYI